MAIRPSWKGHIRFSLVSVPVQAFTAAASEGGEIHLHQLHTECHSRIRYKKFCPIHGEVTNDEIVSGYEYAKDRYVVVDPAEVDKLRTQSDRSMNIDAFVAPDKIDPIYFDGRTYFLAPDTPAGQKPYCVLYKAMEQAGRYAVARVVLSGKEQLVLIRPLEGVLTMSMLNYPSQLRSAADIKDEIPAVDVSAQEMKLARTLIDASTEKKFDISRYQDVYTKRLRALIDLKVAGKEVVAPPAMEEDVPIVNLMDALRRSVAQARTGGSGKARSKPPKKMAASKHHTMVRRRKSS